MSNQQPTPRVTGASPGVGWATGFELASRGQLNAPNIESALERNRAFAAAGGHEAAVVFPNLRLFVITCLDRRVDAAHFLGLGLSDAMVVRKTLTPSTPPRDGGSAPTPTTTPPKLARHSRLAEAVPAARPRLE